MTAAVAVSRWESARDTRTVPAYNLLGVPIQNHDGLGISDFLVDAGMAGWDVHLRPNEVKGVDLNDTIVEDYAVVRTHPDHGRLQKMATVGARYHVLQSEELFGFADSIVGGVGRWETLGVSSKGRKVFGVVESDSPIVLDPDGAADEVRLKLFVIGSFDGSTSLTFGNTALRFGCLNVFPFALKDATQKVTIKHTRSMVDRMKLQVQVSSSFGRYGEAMERELQAMIETETNVSGFWKVFDHLNPVPAKDASKAAHTRSANHRERVEAILNGQADGPDTMANLPMSAYKVMNTLTEELDWYRNPRGGDAESAATSAAGLDDQHNNKRQKIVDAVNKILVNA